MKNTTRKIAAAAIVLAAIIGGTNTTSYASENAELSDCKVTIRNQHSVHPGTKVLAKVNGVEIGSLDDVERSVNAVTTKTFRNVVPSQIDFNTVIAGPDNVYSINPKGINCVQIQKPEIVEVEVIKEVIREVPVEVEVIKEVPVEVIREVEVPVDAPVRAAAPQPQVTPELPSAPVARPVVETPRYNG